MTHEKHKKELIDVLKEVREYLHNANTTTNAEDQRVNALLCKINSIINKHT